MLKQKKTGIALLALMTSSSTLVCCALPALMIALGAGSVLASLVSTFPSLIWISNHKLLVFGFALLMLLVGGYFQLKPASCPVDKALAQACARAKKISRAVYLFSVLLFALGAFFAFILPRIA